MSVTFTLCCFLQRDRRFEKLMRKRGFIIKQMGQDGACLFRSVADQVYGDQEMHAVVRNHCMDYIVSINYASKAFRMTPTSFTHFFVHDILGCKPRLLLPISD